MDVMIVTHNGQFHGDEVLACALLRNIYPKCIIKRTRDNKIINKADIVVDVGGIYDPKKNRFDHHQKGCNEVFSKKHTIPLSSVGMVYKEYGKMVLCDISNNKLNSEEINKLYNIIYNSFIKEMDALDNGIKPNSKNYSINTGLSSTVNKMNSQDIYNLDVQNKCFEKAVNYCYITFEIHVLCMVNKQLSLRNDKKIISSCMKKRYIYSSSGEILVIQQDCSNWLFCIRDYENNNGSIKMKIVIYPGNGEEWRVRAMPEPGFVTRIKLKSKDELLELDKSLEGKITFVHNAGFIGGAKTLEDAVKMANLCLSS
jgi:uncharacterized UPF0160 family protein